MQDRIRKVLDLDAPIDRVWEALTDAEQFGQWFRVRLDGPFVVGRTVTGQLAIEGCERVDWKVVVQAIEPRSLFSFTWHPHAVDPDVDCDREPPTLVEFRLAPIATGTRLTIEESGFAALSDRARREKAFLENTRGWEFQSRNLTAHLER